MKKMFATGAMAAAVAVFGLSAALAAQPAPQAPPVPAPAPAADAAAAIDASLPPGTGRETLLKVCSGCHAPEVVAQQRLTPEGWHELVDKMAGNGALGTDAEFSEITDYLVKNFTAKPGS